MLPGFLQAAALVSAICEPLVQVQVGKLTRRLEAPTILSPAEDRGMLSLWLLPNDDLSLVWQGRATPTHQHASPSQQGRSCEISVWEELARFPANCPVSNDEPRELHLIKKFCSCSHLAPCLP